MRSVFDPEVRKDATFMFMSILVIMPCTNFTVSPDKSFIAENGARLAPEC